MSTDGRRTGERGAEDPPRWRVEPPEASGKPPKIGRRFWILLGVVTAVLLGFNYWLGSQVTDGPKRVRVPYSPFFLNHVRQGNVASISSQGTDIEGRFKQAVRYPPTDEKVEATTYFRTEIPVFADTDALTGLLARSNVVVNAEPLDRGGPLWQSLLIGFLPTLLFIALLVWLFRRTMSAQGGGGMLGQFGRSKARRYQRDSNRITFTHVAGIDEAKAELTEIVDFLRNPERYRRLGGRIPRGVLLSGPPGTGKTLLARAVAGEADVPFFSISASEFIEAIVGVGASRVRDLFNQAKEAAPAIIFIDELDAIGRSRGASGGFGGHDEREQTLNQILTEMDGFDPSSGVIVLASTNRPDVLDQALLRPGRFDRRVAVQPPDRIGRRKILEVHTVSVPLAEGVDLDRIAATTPGMVGADLANLVNEAALLAARRDRTTVSESDFSDALEKIVLGAERKVMMSLADRERTAYHEAGHAIVGMLTPGADPVRKVSIIPRGMALGVTFSSPDDDRFSYDEAYLRARIKSALGGRAAEELVYGERTTGAENDLQQLTAIARSMVGRWGMSAAIGPVSVLPADGRGPIFPGMSEVSEETQQIVDQEVRRIVDEAFDDALALLREHRDKLESLARALLEHETLGEDEAYEAAGVAHLKAPGLEAPEPVATPG